VNSKRLLFHIAATTAAISVISLAPACAESTREAIIFGARNSVQQISLSPDGTKIVYIAPAGGARSVALVAPVGGGEPQPLAQTDGSPWRLTACGWSANTRIVCSLYGIDDADGTMLPYTRLLSMNLDGTNVVPLGQKSHEDLRFRRQFDGNVIDWHNSDNGVILMSRFYIPERANSQKLVSSDYGLGVDEVDSTNGKAKRRETPNENASSYISDRAGTVRIMAVDDASLTTSDLTGVTRYFYRKLGSRDWLPLSVDSQNAPGLRPVAIDRDANAAFAYGKLNGRDALYKVSLDGMKTVSLVYANDKVDVDNIVTLGRGGRVVGVEIVTDKRETIFFDEEAKQLATGLSRALPNLPIIEFVGASRDETKILLHAGSDMDAGRYYFFDKHTRKLAEIMLSRPSLETVQLSPVKPVRYRAADGVEIPGYLTLPLNSTGKKLPAIVMPHGGPASRDEWGFDWMVQYFAARGYAVLQPNFRGSSGYGDDWFVDNGFKSWKIAITDINAGGQWLVDQGIADPQKMAIVGWSYGGYAALQSNVVAPTLFKAVVAVAPIVDLQMLIDDSQNYTNARITRDYIGQGPHVQDGSPLRHANQFRAPVLMFSGDRDLNVNIRHARAMTKALQSAGKSTELITYKGLDHSLVDSVVRADLLDQSDIFLRSKMAIK
jgi:dipeptidyl aminopeptidase/acylaminoacyl peptidase